MQLLTRPSFLTYLIFLILSCSGILHAEIVIQLSAGSRPVLEQEAKKLSNQWSNVRVIDVEGKAKLVVGSFSSAQEAMPLLQTLKAKNPQVFLRKIANPLSQLVDNSEKSDVSVEIVQVKTNAEILTSSPPKSKDSNLPLQQPNNVMNEPEKVISSDSKEELLFQASKKQLDEPVNLMLSPLYILPDDHKDSPNAITMQMLSQSMTKISTVTSSPLMLQLAELADQQRWKEAKQLIAKTNHLIADLNYQESILFGWVYLHNQEPSVAMRYFNQSLSQKETTDGQYGLGLSHLLLNHFDIVRQLIKQMPAGNQQRQLASLLAKVTAATSP